MEVVMLERYFIRPDTVDRIRASWIGEPIERYVGWLTEHRYSTRNVFRRVPILVRFGTFAAGRGATRWDELPAYVDAFVADWVQARGNQADPATRRKVGLDVRNAIEQMLTVALPDHAATNRRPHAPDPFCRQAAGFFTYLREERGLRHASIRHYGHFLRGFEGYLGRVGCHDLKDLSPLLLSAFVTESAGHFGRTAMIGLCSTLRVFLRYLHREGVVGRDLAHGVEPPQVYRLAELPRSITWDEVRRMLETVDCRAPVGRRDYAILLLLVTYGLRAREVAGLTLDDLDWKRERLHVRERKADHVAVYPLSPIVGEAIVDYLRQGRPQTADRHLFFRHLAPHRPLTHAAVSSLASHYLHKAGIPVHRAGSHTLRHTCVQRLVDAGFPLKTIGDYVGHRSASSTEIYAKVAVEALREVALGNGEALP
jgi:integrase/recombinase XerD